MYTKEELEQLSIPELMEIASELGVKVSQNDELESVIYAILDKAAENSAAGIPANKRKRTRIAKKDTDKVYTVNGTDGENLDAKPKKKKAEKKPTIDSLFAEQEAAEQAAAAEQKDAEAPAAEEKPADEKPAPKKRGRKSKKELEEMAAAKAAEEQAASANAATDAAADVIPEAAAVESSEPIEESLINQLQEKMAHTAAEVPVAQPIVDNDIWERPAHRRPGCHSVTRHLRPSNGTAACQ